MKFSLFVIFVFIVAYRLRETGVFYRPSSSGSAFSRISNQGMLDLINTTAAVPDRAEILDRLAAELRGRRRSLSPRGS